MVHTVKGFRVVNEAEVDVLLELSCFLDTPTDTGNLISGSSDFSKYSLNIWKFSVHVLLKPGLENFEHYFSCVWYECNSEVLWTFFGIAFLWNWNENIFSSPMATDEFSKFAGITFSRQQNATGKDIYFYETFHYKNIQSFRYWSLDILINFSQNIKFWIQ